MQGWKAVKLDNEASPKVDIYAFQGQVKRSKAWEAGIHEYDRDVNDPIGCFAAINYVSATLKRPVDGWGFTDNLGYDLHSLIA